MASGTDSGLQAASERRRLGGSGLEVSAAGVGVWSWGERGFWGYGTTYTVEDIKDAYSTSLAAGIDFFDTAEVYGDGRSEKLLGRCIRWAGRPVLVASKFAPLPTRLRVATLARALDASLERLGRDHIDLYQVHWPYSILPIDGLMDEMAAAVRAGKIRAVGVSNYSASQMERAQRALARHGLPLAANQVHFSLLHRKPEANGVLEACRRLDVALIAYSPLAQGVLTGKYTGAEPQQVPLRRRFTGLLRQAGRPETRALLAVLEQIGREREKTAGQVAINWLLCRDDLVIPIPGAKNARQAAQNAGVLGWRLSTTECTRIDQASLPWRR